MKYILALDQGTTSSRAIIFDHQGTIVAVAQQEFRQIFPKPGWVEHDANEIWATQSADASEVLQKASLTGSDVAAIGITNQRETTVGWDRETGQPICHAIVWQDRRPAGACWPAGTKLSPAPNAGKTPTNAARERRSPRVRS